MWTWFTWLSLLPLDFECDWCTISVWAYAVPDAVQQSHSENIMDSLWLTYDKRCHSLCIDCLLTPVLWLHFVANKQQLVVFNTKEKFLRKPSSDVAIAGCQASLWSVSAACLDMDRQLAVSSILLLEVMPCQSFYHLAFIQHLGWGRNSLSGFCLRLKRV